LSNVVRYSFQINPGYVGSLPETGTFALVSENTTFWSSSLQEQPYVNETPTYTVAIKLSRTDFDRNMKVNQADVDVFKACMTGSRVPYDLYNPPANCTCGPVSLAGQDYLKADLDNDGDVDQTDFGYFQRCYSGDSIADPHCGE
jgi:hypothetical protein